MESSDLIEEVEQIVKSKIEEDNWFYHVSIVRSRALELGRILNADLEILELASLLHDVGRSLYGGENHEVTGAKHAVEVLTELSFPSDRIKLVENCILKHRGKVGNMPEALEERILANADAMSHFDQAFYLIYLRSEMVGFEEAVEKTKKGLLARWNGKLDLPEARELVKEEKEVLWEMLKIN